MATTVTLLKDFAGGQGGGAGNYVTYADDLDTNFTDLENTVNQLVNEVKATLASNTLLITDMLQVNDQSGTVEQEGVIGGHSYEVSINGGDLSQLFVQDGQVLVNGIRAAKSTTTTLQGSDAALGSGASNAVSVYVDSNGEPNVVLTASLPANVLEIASLNWDGTLDDFNGTIVQEAPIFFDGDDYASQLSRAAKGDGPSFAAKSFRTVGARVDAIERMFGGLTTDSEGSAIASPEVVELIVDDGSAADPAVQFQSDPDLGIFRISADFLGVAAAQIGPDQLGVVGNPMYSFQGDPDTGIYSPGADRLALSSGGTATLESTLEGHLDSATQPRMDFERSAVQSIATGTALVVVTLDTENTDIGAWGAVSTATVTVPTGGDGFYWLVGAGEFAANATGQRRIAITLNGAGTVLPNRQGDTVINAAGAGVTRFQATAGIALASADVLRLEVAQDSGGALDFQGGLSIVKLW